MPHPQLGRAKQEDAMDWQSLMYRRTDMSTQYSTGYFLLITLFR